MSIDITPVAEAVVALLATIITVFIIPYIKSRTTSEQQETVAKWVKIAVEAAEQLYTGSGRGAEKKVYVMEFLEKHNISLDTEKLEAMVESAVGSL